MPRFSFHINSIILSIFILICFSIQNVEAVTLSEEPKTFGVDEGMWVINGGSSSGVESVEVIDGYTYIGGSFTAVASPESYTGHGVVLDLETAERFEDYPKVDGDVNVAIPDGSGGWYIGGKFNLVDGYVRNNLAHIEADGSVDENWDPDANTEVKAIVVSGDSIYVGGSFTIIGGQNRNKLARLDKETGEVDLNWNPDVNSSVYDVVVSGDGVYVGGFFTSVGGVTRNRIARISSETGLVDSWNPSASSTVYSITISEDKIYVGGGFTSIGGASRNRIARLSSETGLADSWNPNANSTVEKVIVSGTDIFAGGSFTTIGGASRNYVAKLNNTTGAADASWNPNANGKVVAISFSGEDIYIGGNFTTIGGQNKQSVAKLNNTNGEMDVSWGVSFEPISNNAITSIKISDEKVFIGGGFNFLNEDFEPIQKLVRINNSTGEVDLTWNLNIDNTVYGIKASDEYIYLYGGFTTINGQTRNRIARLNRATGELDATWNPSAGSTILSMEISGSIIYVGGSFTSIGGQSRNRIARLSSDTGLADSWNPSASGTVWSITISGSDIYAVGSFTSIGGQTRNRIARLSSDTGLADSWNPNANSTTYSIVILEENVYAGGAFTTIGDQSRNYIAKLNNITGEAIADWNPNATYGTSSPPVTSLLNLGDGFIYVAGSFSGIGGTQEVEKLARLDIVTGEVDTSWNPIAGGGSWVKKILVIDNDLYIMGDFGSIGGIYRSGIARLYPDTEAPEIILEEFSPNPTTDTTPVFTGTASDAIGAASNVQYQINGTGGSWTACAIDDGTGDEKIEGFTCTVSSLTDENYTIYVQSTDSNGNTTSSGEETSMTFTVDATSPTGTVSINSGDSSTNSPVVNLSLSATDNLSGVIEMMLSNNSNFSGASWENYATTSQWTVPSGDGEKTVYVKYRDNAGNISVTVSDTILLDSGIPTGTITINNGDEYTNTEEVTLTIEGTDELGEVTEMKISEDPNFLDASWETYAETKDYTLSSGDGVKNVYIKYKDEGGNESLIYSDYIILDTSTELVIMEIDNKDYDPETNVWTTDDITPTINGEGEVHSEVVVKVIGSDYTTTYDFHVDENGEWSWTPSFTLTKGETYTIQITMTDLAGNTDETEFTLRVLGADDDDPIDDDDDEPTDDDDDDEPTDDDDDDEEPTDDGEIDDEDDDDVIDVDQVDDEEETNELPDTNLLLTISFLLGFGLILIAFNFKTIKKLGNKLK